MAQHRLPALLLGAMAALFSGGCTTDVSPVFIDSFYALAPDAPRSACGSGASMISTGSLDTARSAGFAVGVRVQNQMLNEASRPDGYLNTRDVVLDKAELTYRFAGGASGSLPSATTQTINFQVPSNGNGTGVLTLLTAEAGERMGMVETGELVVTITLTGRMRDSLAVRSSSMDFPIRLCAGCLAPKTECETEQLDDVGMFVLKDGYRRFFCTGDTFGQPDGYACVKVN